MRAFSTPRAIPALALLLAAVCLASTRGGVAQTTASRPVDVRVSVDVSDASTRLLLTHSRLIPYAITQSDGRLEIVYAGPVRVIPSARDAGVPLLEGWKVQGDRTLVLHLGDGFDRYESFELKNPSRLILDLLGGKPTDRASDWTPTTRRPAGTIIVLDPGHGGVEAGATGPTGLREKDVALDLARRLRVVLQRDPGVTVVLTRDDDRLLSLDERTAIANHNRAHLFISLHLNSSRRKTAYGAETYYLSTEATDDEARTLAALENKAYSTDRTIDLNAEGEKKKALELILWDLAQNEFLAESSRLAESVQKELNELTDTRDRGVRQAPFRVLMGATMPAILVEAGFISNADEEAHFKSTGYRDRVALAIGRAVRDYLEGLDRVNGPADAAATEGTARP